MLNWAEQKFLERFLKKTRGTVTIENQRVKFERGRIQTIIPYSPPTVKQRQSQNIF